MPKGIPFTEELQAQRHYEIFHQGVNLFVQKGFHETCMYEIAQVAGLGKSTLCNYFKTKDEILILFFEDQLSDLTDKAQMITLRNEGTATFNPYYPSPFEWSFHMINPKPVIHLYIKEMVAAYNSCCQRRKVVLKREEE